MEGGVLAVSAITLQRYIWKRRRDHTGLNESSGLVPAVKIKNLIVESEGGLTVNVNPSPT